MLFVCLSCKGIVHLELHFNPFHMLWILAYFIAFGTFVGGMGHVFWAQWFVEKDDRFAGVPLDAPLSELATSIWTDARRQAATNDLLLLRGGHFWRRTLDAETLCAQVPKVLREIRADPSAKAEFEAQSPDEQMAAVGKRVLFLVLSDQH
jgi:hypothetical protein